MGKSVNLSLDCSKQSGKLTQFHHADWKRFANQQHLNLKRVPSISFLEYEYSDTRLARSAWDRRSEIASSSQEATAHYNQGIQDASELLYRLWGELVAKAVQELKK